METQESWTSLVFFLPKDAAEALAKTLVHSNKTTRIDTHKGSVLKQYLMQALRESHCVREEGLQKFQV